MGHFEDMNRWREYAKNQGWNRAAIVTPHEWLLTKLRIETPPAIFWPPWIHGILAGAFFGIFWGFFMYFTAWHDRTFYQISIPSVVCGFFFGLAFAVLHWRQRRKVGPVTWEHFKKK